MNGYQTRPGPSGGMTLCCALWAAFLAAGRRQKRARSRARDRRHRHPAAAASLREAAPRALKGPAAPSRAMDAPRLRSNPAAAGPERALRKEVTALADRLKALTAEEERAHAATLARFDDTDDDEDDGAVPPPPPPPARPARAAPAASRDDGRRGRRGLPRARARSARTRPPASARRRRRSPGAARSSRASWPPCTTRAPRACRTTPRRRRPRAASARKRPPRPKPPGGSSSRKAPPAPISTSLAGALADDRWDACQKWTFAHAAAPYPSAEEKAALARKAGWPPGRVNHWFSNMRKRKYLKLRDGTRAPRDAFEAQLYHFRSAGARTPTRRPRPRPPAPPRCYHFSLENDRCRAPATTRRSHAASSEPAALAAARAGGAREEGRGLARLRPCARDGAF